MISIINVGMGNILSVLNALNRLGLEAMEAKAPADLARARAIVLPGVGAFGQAMENLNSLGFTSALQKAVTVNEIPLMGICLGMQLLADESEEHGTHKGLGLVPGQVIRLREEETDNKVPNVGWCRTVFGRKSSLFSEKVGSQNYYYVHSYHMVPSHQEHIVATTLLGRKEVVSAVQSGCVAGVQFHPEKSQDDGLNLLFRWASSNNLFARHKTSVSAYL